MRISLSGLMLIMTLVSVLCLPLFVIPSPWDALILGAVTFGVLPGMVLTGALYSYGRVRAFFLGAGFGSFVPWLAVSILFYGPVIANMDGSLDGESLLFFKITTGILWVLAAVSGVGASLIYSWCGAEPEDDRATGGAPPSQPVAVAAETPLQA